MTQTLVIYHKNCDDGFGAAYAAWKRLGDRAQYVPMDYNDNIDDVDVKDRDVIVADFSFTPENVYHKLLPQVKSLTIIDHHLSAMETWRQHLGADAAPTLRHDEERFSLFFDLDKSGALLAWEYFHPGEEVPRMIRHISDGDLWRFDIEGTQPFYSYLRARPRDFPGWDELCTAMQDPQGVERVLGFGRMIDGFYHQQLAQVLAAKRHVDIEMTAIVDGQRVTAKGLAINTSRLFVSEMGNMLATQSGSFAIVWETDGTTAFCGMRSIAGFDCIPYASAQGGGGHAQACGFTIPLTRLLAALRGEHPLSGE